MIDGAMEAVKSDCPVMPQGIWSTLGDRPSRQVGAGRVTVMVFQRQITMMGSLMLGLLGSLVSGCTETVIHDSWSDLKQLRGEDRSFWQRPAHASLSSQHEDRRRWAILLRRFEGADQHEQARGLLKRLRHEVRLTDVWVQEAAARTLV